jgi:Zn2+/Cd2+-exporting ATPase
MRYTADIEGMDCPGCASKIERAVGDLDEVESVSVNLMGGKLVAEIDRQERAQELEAVVGGLGYRIRSRDEGSRGSSMQRSSLRDPRLWSVSAGAVLIVAALIATHLAGLSALGVALYVGAIAAGGWFVFRNAARAARRLDLDIHVLMSVAVVGAMFLGEWFEASTVVVLFGLAEWLEGASISRARRAIGELMELAPDVARVHRDGREQVMPVEEVNVGDMVIVRPGEKIPVDGVVESGASEVDQSPITGESKPALKARSDEVYAATLNQHGSLDIRVTRASSETTLSRVIAAVEDAQQNRSRSERLVERFARYYTPAVLVLALVLVALAPLVFGGGFEMWFYRALVLLVIACPCALVIATPVTTASALARAAREGILFKGGRFLEELGRVEAVAFDKTGTLTRGEPQVAALIPAEGVDEDELLGQAALAESRSEHYLGRAVIAEAARRGVEYDRRLVTSFEARVGRGVQARVRDASNGECHGADPHTSCSVGEPASLTRSPSEADSDGAESCCEATVEPTDESRAVGSTLLVGSRRLLAEHGVDIDPMESAWSEHERRGSTVVAVARAGRLLGLIAIEDRPRDNASGVIERLRARGIEQIFMLTGDNAQSAQSIAARLDLDEAHVLADLLPADKVDAVERLTAEHRHVAMVGDGINDAPALASAPVGIAMGAAGTDIALDTAHVALMSDNLDRLPDAIGLGQRTTRVIAQNVALALGIKALVFGLAAFGHATLWMAILADMGTSLLVIFNGMRLLRSR